METAEIRSRYLLIIEIFSWQRGKYFFNLLLSVGKDLMSCFAVLKVTAVSYRLLARFLIVSSLP